MNLSVNDEEVVAGLRDICNYHDDKKKKPETETFRGCTQTPAQSFCRPA